MPTKKYLAPKYVDLIPKTEKGKEKLGSHGSRWVWRDTVAKLKYSSLPGPFLVLRSRMGNAVLFVKEEDDPNFQVNKLQ